MSQACLRCFLATPILCNFARSAGIENNCFLNSAAFIVLRTKIKTILRIQEREGGGGGVYHNPGVFAENHLVQ